MSALFPGPVEWLQRACRFLKASLNVLLMCLNCLILSLKCCLTGCSWEKVCGEWKSRREEKRAKDMYKGSRVNRPEAEVTAEKMSLIQAARARVQSQSGLFTDSSGFKNLPDGGSWVRAKDFLPTINPGKPITLWGEGQTDVETGVELGPHPLDLGQGRIGDCYLICACSSLAEEPDRVKSIIANDAYDEANGLYVVLLFVSNKWVQVEVDDRFYIDKDNKPMLSNSKNTSRLWGMLIEKAYLKQVCGGDCAKLGGGGHPFTAFYHLHGKTAGGVQTDSITGFLSNDELFSLLEDRLVRNPDGVAAAACERLPPCTELVPTCCCGMFTAVCARPCAHSCREMLPYCFDFAGVIRNCICAALDCSFVLACMPCWLCVSIGIMKWNLARTGLVAGHAYSILDVKEVPVGSLTACALGRNPFSSEKVQLVKMRNPWGTGEWRGKFSDSSCYWNNESRELCKVKKADDGVFWVTISDFRRYFTHLSVAPWSRKLLEAPTQKLIDTE